MPQRELPEIPVATRLSGLEPLNITEDSLFVNIGERTNITGSARFRNLIKAEDYDSALSVALQQVEVGAQVIDINMDEGMIDGVAAMCAGVVPQQPPTRLTNPLCANSSRTAAVSSGDSSYSPNALGRPAFG